MIIIIIIITIIIIIMKIVIMISVIIIIKIIKIIIIMKIASPGLNLVETKPEKLIKKVWGELNYR